jgi:hypothetical protein
VPDSTSIIRAYGQRRVKLKQLTEDGPYLGPKWRQLRKKEIEGKPGQTEALKGTAPSSEKGIKLSLKPASQRCIWRRLDSFLMREGKQHELA